MATINVYTERTPNPATMKFLVNKLLVNGALDYPNREQAQESPFARELVKFNFVDCVLIASKFLNVTKATVADWEDIVALLLRFVKGPVEADLKIQSLTTAEPIEFEVSETEVRIQQIQHHY